jgi:Trk K+ transport system NAD-binding subunit
MLAHFYAGEQLFQITEHIVAHGERWVGSPIEAVQVAGRQIIVHIPADGGKHGEEAEFYGWHPEEKIHVGDRLLLLTRNYTIAVDTAAEPKGWVEAVRGTWRDFEAARRRGLSRSTMVALVSLAVILGLSVLAALTFAVTPPFLGWTKALRLGVLLIFGGHLADVTEDYEGLPSHVLAAEMVLTIMGTLLTAVLYALLTDSLLTARFNLLSHRPRAPARGHVIIAGVGATGERIAGMLKQLRRPAVGIDDGDLSPHVAPHLPVIRAQPTLASSLEEAHLASAHGLAAVTADELQNVQIALLAASLNPRCRLAVRIFDPRLSENVSSVLPDARILCIAKLAATAYAAAALGEHVLSLFQMPGRPVLVVEFLVSAGDTLDKRALWELIEGYSVVPVLFQPAGGTERAPSLDDAAQRLSAGDRLIVLASPVALEAIERGDMRPREYELTLERLRPYAEPLQVVGVLAQRFGHTLEQANSVLADLPQTVPLRLYGLYARRTCRVLQANGVECSLRRIVAQGPRGVVETLSQRPRRETAFDMRRNVNRAVQSRDS